MTVAERKKRWRHSHRMVDVERLKECSCIRCQDRWICQELINEVLVRTVRRYLPQVNDAELEGVLKENWKTIRTEFALKKLDEDTNKRIRLLG